MLEARANDACSSSLCAGAECGCTAEPSDNQMTTLMFDPTIRQDRLSVVRGLYLEDYVIALIFVIAWVNGIYVAYTA